MKRRLERRTRALFHEVNLIDFESCWMPGMHWEGWICTEDMGIGRVEKTASRISTEKRVEGLKYDDVVQRIFWEILWNCIFQKLWKEEWQIKQNLNFWNISYEWSEKMSMYRIGRMFLLYEHG